MERLIILLKNFTLIKGNNAVCTKITRAKSAQNFGSKSKFYVFKTKIQKYPLEKSQKIRNSLK